jgi:hypothetical protein
VSKKPPTWVKRAVVELPAHITVPPELDEHDADAKRARKKRRSPP